MKIESQVCSLEQSKKLKELGVVQDSFMYQSVYADGQIVNHIGSFIPLRNVLATESYSMFTVAELGVMLGYFMNFVNWVADGKIEARLEHQTVDRRERNYGTGTTDYSTRHQYEAQARAAMLIYLLENNLVTPAEINARLTHIPA